MLRNHGVDRVYARIAGEAHAEASWWKAECLPLLLDIGLGLGWDAMLRPNGDLDYMKDQAALRLDLFHIHLPLLVALSSKRLKVQFLPG